ncbi:hypothetical protein FFWV33_15980 [Flavobacterium faecale]|uniref:Transporter n=1 Tax=Flavobacterium faecale TaxID=1355330 RepID=A0A2S1LGT7_9FLAO|nr:TolC family protein [Flavobacterium faecale]AWG22918.1 hypothetical protein FFWV33_15980 [Flavobacterium faecale]
MKLYLTILSLFFLQLNFAQVTPSPKIWTLNDCITYAIENNITIKEAALSRSSSQVDYEKSKSSRLPNLFGTAGQNFSNGNAIDPITSAFVSNQINSTNFGINSAMTLYQGNTINNQIKQNELLLNQSILQEEVEKNNIVLNLLETYLQALYSKESIDIAQNNLTASEKEVLRAKSRLDAGSIAINDYTEAQSQAATNKYTLITAKNTYQQYIISLKQLLELGPNETMEIATVTDSTLRSDSEQNKASVYENAIKFLPELGVSNLNIAVNEKKLDIVKGPYLPTLSLTSSLGTGYTSTNLSSFSDQLNLNFNQRVGVSLSVPIFNRNATKAAVKTATINIEKAKLQKQTTEKAVYKKIETAYQNAMSAQEQIAAAEAAQTAAESSFKLAQKKYELGALSTTDLVISQNTYTNAQQTFLQAKYLQILYNQLLEFYQGNGIKL